MTKKEMIMALAEYVADWGCEGLADAIHAASFEVLRQSQVGPKHINVNYKGKLYGKIGGKCFELNATAEQFDALQSENERMRKALKIANDDDLKDQYADEHTNGGNVGSYGYFLNGWNKCLEVIKEEAQAPGQVGGGETVNEMDINETVQNELDFCEENDFEKNDHGLFIYKSMNGISSINLPYILADYKEWLIENELI